MTAQAQIIPSYDASEDVTDWWDETIDGKNECAIMALYETSVDSAYDVVARGANGYGCRDRDEVMHYFLGLTIENRNEIRFIDLPEFIALGEQHGFDASKLIGAWQDQMDFYANN